MSFLSDVGNAIGSVVPTQVSDAAAGVIDGIAFDEVSRHLGIPQSCWSGWHNAGQIAGAAGARVFTGGLGSFAAAEGLGLETFAAGTWGGAIGGATTGLELRKGPAQVIMDAVIGMRGGVASFALSEVAESGTAATIATGNAGGATVGFGFDTGGAMAAGGSDGMSAQPKDGSC